MVSVLASANAGYSFSNWSGDISGTSNPASITINGPKTVTANFTQNQYSLTVNINPPGGGSVSKNPNKSTYVYNEQVSVTAAANSGYTFSNWSGDASGSANPTTITMNGNKTVTANFRTATETVSTPTIPSGPTAGIINTSYTYSAGSSSSNLGHSVQYRFDWGDGTYSNWSSSTSASKSWSSAGTYSVRAQARCATHTSVVSSWSSGLSVNVIADNVFLDVPSGYWAYDYIIAIYNNGITTGCVQDDPSTPENERRYCPEDSVTRGQMAAFIIRAKYGETFSYTTTPYFTDVPSTHTFFKYVQKLRDDGITVVIGTYWVDDYVTRGQMVAFIIRAKFGENFTYTTTPYFSDVSSTHNFFKYVQKMKDEGITAVTGVYDVDSVVTRAQMAAFLARAFLGME